jgi:hypothetical protein
MPVYGDLKAFKPNGKPYNEKQILKLECVGHEQERIGTHL